MKIVNGMQFIAIEISASDWQVIIAGLNELPRKISDPVLQRLVLQVTEQSQPQKIVPDNPPFKEPYANAKK
jgi:hypothetical protein